MGIPSLALSMPTSRYESHGLASARPNTTTEGGASTSHGSERQATLKKACADLESIFLDSLFKAIRQAMLQDSDSPGSSGMETYSSIADQQLAIALSQGRGLGLGRMLYQQLLQREGLTEDGREDPAAPQALTQPNGSTQGASSPLAGKSSADTSTLTNPTLLCAPWSNSGL